MAVLPFASHVELRLEIDRLTDWITKLSATRDRLPKTEKALVNGGSNGPTLLSLHPSLSRHNLLLEKENSDITPLLESDNADKLAEVLDSGELTEFKGALDETQVLPKCKQDLKRFETYAAFVLSDQICFARAQSTTWLYTLLGISD